MFFIYIILFIFKFWREVLLIFVILFFCLFFFFEIFFKLLILIFFIFFVLVYLFKLFNEVRIVFGVSCMFVSFERFCELVLIDKGVMLVVVIVGLILLFEIGIAIVVVLYGRDWLEWLVRSCMDFCDKCCWGWVELWVEFERILGIIWEWGNNENDVLWLSCIWRVGCDECWIFFVLFFICLG